MKHLTLDFETKDPYIERGLGSGWVYGINVESSDFEVLGAAVRTDEGSLSYIVDWEELSTILKGHDNVICHNLSYDLGCLYYLQHIFPDIDFNIDNLKFTDTLIMAKLFNSTYNTYSLDNLSNKFFNERKCNKDLADYVWESGLYKGIKEAQTNRKVNTRPKNDSVLEQFSKSHLKEIQINNFKLVEKYAIKDVELTWNLFNLFRFKIDSNLLTKYCSLIPICLKYRLKGIRVDLNRLKEVQDLLTPMIDKAYKEVYKLAGEEFNINSCKDLPSIFDKLGIEYPKTALGNPSIRTKWLETKNHDICKSIIEARKLSKIKNDFIDKIMDMQEYTGYSSDDNYGRVYPELHPLRAKTGRFSCTNPNIQQIPSRDPVLSPLCRSIFVPEEGEEWYSLDFSNQEGRLQVHYANKLGCQGADALAFQFNKDPYFDMHQEVADMMSIDRKTAKAINLGISYGMGIDTLASNLNISFQEAKELRIKYNELAPFLTDLNEVCKTTIKKRGYIKTIGGRHLHIDPPSWINGKRITYEYKALNKLIQGSAADQIMEAMIIADKRNINISFAVHDELCFSGKKSDAKHLKTIMEQAIVLDIPCVIDIGEGTNWSEAK